MKRKSVHKKHIEGSPRKPSLGFSLTVLGVFFASFFAIVGVLQLTSTVHVLGAHTVLLAKDGESKDSQESEHFENTVSQEQVPQVLVTPSPFSQKTETESASSKDHVSGDTLVDCVTTDGTHVTVTFTACQKLHKQIKQKSFSFTPLTKSSSSLQPAAQAQSSPSAQTQKHEEDSHTEKEKKTGESEDGIIDSHEAKTTIKIESDEHDNPTISQETVTAHSTLPVSIDKTTDTLKVTTDSGEEEIHVLPQKAVENVLQANILTNVENESASDSSTITQKVSLTQLNSQPVFAVNGVLEKKVLGVIPVAFSKTVFVSATDGTVVKTDETLLNSLLEKISF